MNSIKLENKNLAGVVTPEQISAYDKVATDAIYQIENATGEGSDFLGWAHLPSSITDAEIEDINNTAKNLSDNCDVVVAVGIGGSFLGAKAVNEALSDAFADRKSVV